MPPGALQVNDDGTLLLTQPAQDTEGLEDTLSRFADRTSPSDIPPRYRLSSASVCRARRMGLSLETIIQTLETHSGRDLPDKLLSELTLWSQQIDRLWLEVDQGRPVLRSANPLVITAVMRHRTLKDFVTEQRLCCMNRADTALPPGAPLLADRVGLRTAQFAHPIEQLAG